MAPASPSAPKTAHCPNCGSPLPEQAPHELCPRCLFAQLEVATDASDGLPSLTPSPSQEDLGPHFPQLEIMETLGRGGMGVVYKARQKSLDRLVALKLLAPERVHDPAFAQRFSQEAQALARLNHPNIVTIHDFGQAGGYFYLLMEFVDGVNLRQAMQVGRFTPEQALGIVPPVCEALEYAHERGIVHRDIKPENLLLDKEGRVKIADFGVAKMLGSADGGASEVSGAGGTATLGAGTPSYMAPEQAKTGKVDRRADIYSLGVVLYELLTGELPGAKLQPPSSRGRGMRIDVRIDEIVLRALEKAPELRFATAAEFRTQVESATQAATGSSAPSAESASGSPSRLSRTAIAGFCVWIIALVASGFSVAFILSMWRRAIPGGNALPVEPFWAHASSLVMVLPGVMAALLASLLGWIAVGQIRRSSGRLRGMALALFDALLLPLAAMLGLITWFWMWLLHDVVASVIDGAHGDLSPLQRVLTLHPTGLALVASFVVGMLAAFFGIRSIWRAVHSPVGQAASPSAEKSGTKAPSWRKHVPRWIPISALALCFVVLIAIKWRSLPAPVGTWTADRISNSAPATGDVVVQIEKVERRGQIVWVQLRTSSAGRTVRIRPRLSAWLSALPPVVPVMAHESPSHGPVLLELKPGPPPYELRMTHPEAPDIFGPGPVWIGFALPSDNTAALAEEQITRLHVNHPQGLTADRSALLLFSLSARAAKPASGEKIMADVFFDLGPQTRAQASSVSWPRVKAGRVIELVILDPAVDAGCLLDFETGRFITPPRELAEKLAQGVADIGPESAQWLRESGADAAVKMPDRGALRMYEGFALSRAHNPAQPLTWKQFTDADVIATLATATFEQQQRFQNSDKGYYATPATSPTALAFMTREGSMGLMEILGRNASPAGTKIRYRLVKVASPSSTGGSAIVTGFIREPKPVQFDAHGSRLEFITASDGKPSFSIIWIAGASRSEFALDVEGFFKAPGWFVFIESPRRLWLYDGGQRLDLVDHDGTRMRRTSAKSAEASSLCPKAVWDALPESARPLQGVFGQ